MDSENNEYLELELYHRYQEIFARRNFLFLAKACSIFYIFWAFFDNHFGTLGLPIFLGLRILTIIPILISIYLVKHRAIKNIDRCVYILFVIVSCGSAISSYLSGMFFTDLAYGLMLLSFFQYITLPKKKHYIIATDLTVLLTYFPFCYIFMKGENDILIKQFAMYFSFSFLKFLSTYKLHCLIYGTYSKATIARETQKNREVSHLFGELCHLISNPLFISQSSLKLAQRTSESEKKDKYIDSSLATLGRISDVVKKMQSFHRNHDVTIDHYKEELYKDID